MSFIGALLSATSFVTQPRVLRELVRAADRVKPSTAPTKTSTNTNTNTTRFFIGL